MLIEGLKGEVFEMDGRVGIAIPPTGQPGAIRFVVVGVHDVRDVPWPAWADVVLNGRECCRINLGFCTPPFLRFADCVATAHNQRQSIPLPGTGTAGVCSLPPPPDPDSQDFVFWKEMLGEHEVVMIDMMESFERCHPTLADGQHRFRGI